MVTTSIEHSDAREKLLVAAQTLYAENGVAATTPRQVLQRSAVGQGSLYHHFPSKKDLAYAAVARTVQEQLGVWQRELTGEVPPQERIAGYLQRDRDAVAGCRVGRLTSDPLVMTEGRLRESVGEYFTELLGLVEKVFVESGLDQENARDRAATTVAVIQGGYVLSRATGDAAWMRRATQGLLALLDTPHSESEGSEK